MLFHRGWQTSDACPLCHKGPEKSCHVITCQHVDAKNLFEEKIKKELSDTMKKNKTCPAIQSVILEAFKLHRRKKTYLLQRPRNCLVKRAVNYQQEIGWDIFF